MFIIIKEFSMKLIKASILLLSICLVVHGCLKSPPPQEEAGEALIFKEASSLFEKGKFDKAAEKFQEFRQSYPTSPLYIRAQIKTIEAFYFDGKYTEALAQIQTFIDLHPKSEHLPFMLFLKGMCYFNQRNKTNRDPTYTMKALEFFSDLIRSYPSSTYAVIAEEKSKICIKELFDYELNIAEFYYRTSKYEASQRRLEEMFEKYRDVDGHEKIIYLLGKIHMYKGDNEKAAFYFKSLIDNYPKSPYAYKSKKLLEILSKNNHPDYWVRIMDFFNRY
ncbi:MAG: outer membrane protein assembly factor BamD [Candidatus Aenigmatarchaeota archaeon]